MRLAGMRVAVLVESGFEDLEFWTPLMRLREEGAVTIIAGLEAGRTVNGKHGLTATSEVAAGAVSAASISGVLVPGGWAPDKLRRYQAVTNLVRSVYEQNKVVGLICHAGLVAISAGIVKGHRATGSLGIKDDLVNAGAVWVDEAAFRDGCLVWGRVVEDIPDYCREVVAALEDSGGG